MMQTMDQQTPPRKMSSTTMYNTPLNQVLQATSIQYLELSMENKSLQDLQQEPQRLQNQITQLQQQIIQVSTEKYDQFLATEQAISSANHYLQAASDQLQQLTSTVLPKLHQETTHFVQQAAPELHKERTRSKQCLAEYDNIATLLDIPTLAETCIRNEMYTEALDLDEYVRNLAKNNPDIPILCKLQQETEQMVLLPVMKKLVQHVKSTLSVPQALKLVSHLRRANVLTERELRILFAQCRCVYIQQQMAKIPKLSMSSYQYMYDITTLLKVQIFELVTQYQAVFPMSATTSTELQEHTILPTALTHVVDQYMTMLKDEVALITSGEELNKLLEQCMFCGQTLARVGTEFRSLTVAIFVSRVKVLFDTTVTSAVQSLINQLQQYAWTENQKTNVLIDQAMSDNAPPSDTAPPRSLLAFLPVAELMNELLRALNELRCCAPVQLKHHCGTVLQDEMRRLLQTLQQINIVSLIDKEQESIAKQNYKEMVKCIQTLNTFVVKSYKKIWKDVE